MICLYWSFAVDFQRRTESEMLQRDILDGMLWWALYVHEHAGRHINAERQRETHRKIELGRESELGWDKYNIPVSHASFVHLKSHHGHPNTAHPSTHTAETTLHLGLWPQPTWPLSMTLCHLPGHSHTSSQQPPCLLIPYTPAPGSKEDFYLFPFPFFLHIHGVLKRGGLSSKMASQYHQPCKNLSLWILHTFNAKHCLSSLLTQGIHPQGLRCICPVLPGATGWVPVPDTPLSRLL